MNIEEIKELAQIMKDADLTMIEVTENDFKIRLKKETKKNYTPTNTNQSEIVAVSQEEDPKQQTSDYTEVKSPMVGIFYRSSSPQEDPFVEVGTRVKKGDVLCIIEAMKVMNEIISEVDGEIAEISIENGELVEYGATIFKMK